MLLEDKFLVLYLYLLPNSEFNFSAYEQVRKKYNAEGAFPHLYDKIRPEIDVFKVGKEYMDPL